MRAAIVPAAFLLAGCTTVGTADTPGMPSRDEAARALVGALSCIDRDGLTDCMPEQPVRVVLDRFQCVPEPPDLGELARVDCGLSGTLIWNNGRRQRLPGRRAYFRQVAGYGNAWLSSGLYDRSTAHPDR